MPRGTEECANYLLIRYSYPKRMWRQEAIHNLVTGAICSRCRPKILQIVGVAAGAPSLWRLVLFLEKIVFGLKIMMQNLNKGELDGRWRLLFLVKAEYSARGVPECLRGLNRIPSKFKSRRFGLNYVHGR